MNVQTCPEKSLLREFLDGRLANVELKHIEQHLLECLQCEDTIRMLNGNDTFEELAQSILKNDIDASDQEKYSIESQNSESVIANLIERVRSMNDSREIRIGKNRKSVTDSLKRMADTRALEVILLLEPAETDESIGILANYEVLELLGVGSTGVVFKALDRNLQRYVALKVLRPSLGAVARERFLQEARIAAALDHDNVITIYQVGHEDSLAFIAMQLLPGETLECRLAREGSIPVDEAKGIARQIAQGLQVAHDRGMIHRDIKPANIWLESDRNRVKLLDFGLACITDDDLGFTDTGMIAGTPTFMSPEQSRGSEIDQRSDLFSLGCVLYQMTTGQLPFQAKNVLATLMTIQRHEPVAPCDLSSTIPAEFSDLIRCMIAKAPEHRPASANQFLDALELPASEWAFEVPQQQTLEAKLSNGDSAHVLQKTTTGKYVLATAAFILISLGCYFFGSDVIRVITDQGELVIKTEDKDISVNVSQNGELVDVVDLKTNQSFNIKSGEYHLAVAGNENGFTFSKNTVTMTRGGKTVVTITKTKQTMEKQIFVCRRN